MLEIFMLLFFKYRLFPIFCKTILKKYLQSFVATDELQHLKRDIFRYTLIEGYRLSTLNTQYEIKRKL